MDKKIETFQQFLEHFYPAYKIDDVNHEVIKQMNLWVHRDRSFENQEEGYYLEKGFCLIGNVGTGKTQLMRMLGRYISFVRLSWYQFRETKVWTFAEGFKKEGYRCFDRENTGNRFYDELCLFNEKTNVVDAEIVNHFGDKILVGERLLRVRYEVFIDTGFQSHFTSNANEEILRDTYGERAYSRLFEMCNVFTMIGTNRRYTSRPPITRNKVEASIPRPKELTRDEVDANKRKLNADYNHYCKTGALSPLVEFDYNLLVYNGCDLGTEDYLRNLMDTIKLSRKQDIASYIEKHKQNPSNVDRRFRILHDQYRTDKLDDEERNLIWTMTRKHAVSLFYERLKSENKKVIFDIGDVDDGTEGL